MKRNMWKIAESMKGSIPPAYDLTYGEAVELKEKI